MVPDNNLEAHACSHRQIWGAGIGSKVWLVADSRSSISSRNCRSSPVTWGMMRWKGCSGWVLSRSSAMSATIGYMSQWHMFFLVKTFSNVDFTEFLPLFNPRLSFWDGDWVPKKKPTSMAAAWCNASSAEMTFRIPYGKKVTLDLGFCLRWLENRQTQLKPTLKVVLNLYNGGFPCQGGYSIML